MNGIFNTAITHRIIEFNPLATVLHIQHDREVGEALTLESEKTILNQMISSDCAQELALMLFCGLRPNEVETVEIHGAFIKSVNSKRHFKDKNKVEYKYIPICNRLQPFISNGINVTHTSQTVRRRLRDILPNNTLKDLRTTFYTKCQMLGVAEPALKEFMGHSFGKLGNAYSDLTKYRDYLLKEGEKLNNW
jgi:integrase